MNNYYILSKINRFEKDENYKKVYYKNYGFRNYLSLVNKEDKDPGWILFKVNEVNTDYVKLKINGIDYGYLKNKEKKLIKKFTLIPKYYYIIIYKNNKEIYLAKIRKEVPNEKATA